MIMVVIVSAPMPMPAVATMSQTPSGSMPMTSGMMSPFVIVLMRMVVGSELLKKTIFIDRKPRRTPHPHKDLQFLIMYWYRYLH
jgi:hypothetical protein